MRLVFLGPPGVGKGTQAHRSAEHLGVPHIATGDLLRNAAQLGAPVGRQAKAYMDRGDLVPDDIIVGVLAERIAEPDCAQGFLLDGFPRTQQQAEALDRALSAKDLLLDAAVDFRCPSDVLVERLSGRRTCGSCGENCHIHYRPPAREGICDACGGKLYQRDDDRPETIRQRLEVYADRTAGVADIYRKRGILREIDARDGVEKIQANLLEVLGEARADKGSR